MRLSSIVAPLACLAGLVNAALTTIEYDLMFPRNNVSYAPGPYLPIVFAVKNYNPAFEPSFLLRSERRDGSPYTMVQFGGNVWGEPAANDTAFLYTFFDVAIYNFTEEGTRPINFWISWTSCGDGPNGHGDSDSDTTYNHSSTASVLFRTDKGGQPINLLSSKDTQCPGLPGIRISLDDTIKPVVDPSTATVGIHECMTIMNVDVEGSDVVTDACTAKLPAALVEEVSWSLSMAECLDVPSCSATAVLTPPSKTATGSAAATHTGSTTAPAAAATTTGTDPAKNAGERVAMVGTAGLAVAFSVFGLLLA